jgi:hypothetical protein
MPGIEQFVRYRCPLKSACIGRLLPGTSQTWPGAPLRLHQRGLGGPREATALAYTLRPRGSVCKNTRKFF